MRFRSSMLLAGFALAAASSAQVSLTSGNTVALGAAVPYTATQIATKTDTFTGLSESGQTVFTGSLVSYVFQRTGVSTLDFGFLLTNNQSSIDPIEKLTVSGYAPFTTSVLQNGSGQLATTANRTGSGVVAFNYIAGIGNGYLNQGSTGTLLIIQTNATSYTNGNASIIDGGVGTAATYMPQAVPEPASMTALAVGGLGLLRRRRKA